jgi:hypothetical protein
MLLLLNHSDEIVSHVHMNSVPWLVRVSRAYFIHIRVSCLQKSFISFSFVSTYVILKVRAELYSHFTSEKMKGKVMSEKTLKDSGLARQVACACNYSGGGGRRISV